MQSPINAKGLPVDALLSGLSLGEEGIYFAGSAKEISYPEEGNELCFSVEDNSFWFQHRNKCLAAVCERLLPERFLADVGGGNGAVSAFLAQRGFQTVLVEPGLQGCRNARRRGLPAVVCGTLQDANFPPGSLSAVGAFDVLEHIENEADFLAACHQTLAPGGKLVLTVPALSFLWSHEDVLAGHFRRYRIASLARVVEKAGFKVDYATYFFSLLVPAVFLGRSLPDRFRKLRPEIVDMSRDHLSAGGRLLARLLAWEQTRLSRLQNIPSGSSVLLVASSQ